MSSSLSSAAPPKVAICGGPMLSYACRLHAGADLVGGIKQAAQHAMLLSKTNNAFLQTAVGSLTYAKLRMANAEAGKTNEIKEYHERFEVVSLVGTFNLADDNTMEMHVHMSVSDANGKVFGGHLLAGTLFTTLELVLGVIPSISFGREMDAATGFGELVVRQVLSSSEAATSNGAAAAEDDDDKKKRARQEEE